MTEINDWENLICVSEITKTKRMVINIGLIVCINKLDLVNIVLTKPWYALMRVTAVEKVKNTPVAPTYITTTIQEGSLYLSLLKPSIWNGRHIAAEKAATILERVVNIFKVPIPASELPLLKKSDRLKDSAIKVTKITSEQMVMPEI